MGLRVVASDADPEAPGFELADDRVLASVYDIEATVEAARSLHERRPIAGVLCIGVDATCTVAAVAEALALESVSMDVARRTTDKLAMKERFRADGVTIPWFAPVQSVSELRLHVRSRGLPLVLKPIDSRGSRGVLRLTPDVDLDWAMEHAMSFSERSMGIVEEFIPGRQISSETVLFDERAFTVGLADRNYEKLEAFAPYILEDGGVLPADLSPGEREECCRVVEQAARSLGVTRGVVKGDLVLGPGGVVVIELAARLSGGGFSTVEIPLSTGVDLVGAAIRLALGEQPDPEALAPTRSVHVAQRYLFPKPGRIVAIHGADDVAAREGIEHVQLNAAPGDRVRPITDHSERPGLVIASGSSRDEATRRAKRAVSDIQVETEEAVGI
jgi:biotin carboxylase